MNKIIYMLLVVFCFFCSACSFINKHPSTDSVRHKIFSAPDWSESDTRHMQSIIEYTYTGQRKPIVWSAASNPNIIFSVSDMKFLLNSDYYVKQFVIKKENTETGVILEDEVLASKKKNGDEYWTWKME